MNLFHSIWDAAPCNNWLSVSICKAGDKKPINSELWHACAGPLVSMPPVGSLVVYFPQGHSEQVQDLSVYYKNELIQGIFFLKKNSCSANSLLGCCFNA
jgi:hypothetical protein